jgi:hypothetical protein
LLRALSTAEASKPALEYVVDGVPVDGLFVLLANFEDTAPEGSLHERRGGGLSKLFGHLPYLLFTRFGNVELLLRGLNLGVGIAGVQEAVRKVREGFVIGEVPQFGELSGGVLALKPGKPAGKCGERPPGLCRPGQHIRALAPRFSRAGG